MATPANRVPVRIARGSKANLDTAIAAGDLKEGEICYATDENGIYVVEGGTLTQAGADLASTSIDALSDVDTTTAAPADGQALVWNNSASQWEPGGVSGEIEWTLTANGTTDYIFAGAGFAGTETDPAIYVVRGQTYKFTNGMGAHPFQIQSTQGTSGTAYNDGITNNGVSNGTLTWEVRMDAPSTLYYQCTSHALMAGVIHVLNEGSAVASIDDLSDVDTSTVAPTDGQALVWDNANSKWEPGTISGGGGTTLPSGTTDGEALIWENGAWAVGPAIGGVNYSQSPNVSSNYTAPTGFTYWIDTFVLRDPGSATLSNNDLTATCGGAITQAYSTSTKNSGLWYWEISIDGGTDTNAWIGIAPLLDNWVGSSESDGFGINGGGGVANDTGGTAVSSVSSHTSGDIRMFALDADNKKLWIGKNGTWENSGDPAAGTGEVLSGWTGTPDWYFICRLEKINSGWGNTIQVTGTLGTQITIPYSIDKLDDVDTSTVAPTDGQALVWDNANSKWEPGTISSGTSLPLAQDGEALIYENGQWVAGPVIGGVNYTISAGSQVSNYTPPTGYTVWNDTWVRSHGAGGQTLSNNDLTVTMIGGLENQAGSSTDKSTGKWYWEIEATTIDDDHNGSPATDTAYGITVDPGTVFHNTTDTGTAFRADGSWGGNNGGTRVNLSGFTDGDILMFALDVDNKKLFVGKNGVWENSGDPAAGSGAVFYDWTTTSPAWHFFVRSYGAGNVSTITVYTSTTSTTTTIPYSIDKLDDVDTSTVAPTDGQALVWDNTAQKWEPGTVSGGSVASIDDIGDVDTTTVAPTDGQALVWDNANSKWEPGTVSGGGGTTLPSGTADGEALIWEDGAWAVGPVIGGVDYTTNSGSQVTTYALPAGFSHWNDVFLLSAARGTLSNNDLTSTQNAAGELNSYSATTKNTGKWYWEVEATALNSDGIFGILQNPTGGFPGGGSSGGIGIKEDGTWFTSSQPSGTTVTNVSNTVSGDILMFALDADASKLWFGRNGTWDNSGDPAAGTGDVARGWSNTLDWHFAVRGYNIGTTYEKKNYLSTTTTNTVIPYSIDKLDDVDTSTVAPTDGQALVWDNTAQKWEPGTVSGGGGTTLPSANDGEALIYENGAWVAGPVIGGVDYVPSNADANFSSVSLLLKGNGTNGSTTFTDSSNNALTVTGTGTAQISTTESKFGGASISLPSSGDKLSIAANALFDFGSAAWTMEMWIYWVGPAASGEKTLVANRGTWSADALFWTINGNQMRIVKSGTGYSATTVISQNTWTHVAATYDGSNLRFFVDGVLDSTHSVSGTWDWGDGGTDIGAMTQFTNNFTGYMDEVRITKGIARYTASFSVQTAGFPTVGTQVTIPYSIDKLDDVDTSTVAPTDGQALVWDNANSQWEPGTISGGTTLPSANDGEALIYENGQWVAGPVIGGVNYSGSQVSTYTAPSGFNYWNDTFTFNSGVTGITLSNNDLTAEASSTQITPAYSTSAKSTGKWYWEMSITGVNTDTMLGITVGTNSFPGASGTGGLGLYHNGTWFNNSGATVVNTSSLSESDVVMFALDADAKKLWVGLNGTWENSGDPAAGTGAVAYSWTATPDWLFAVRTYNPGMVYTIENTGGTQVTIPYSIDKLDDVDTSTVAPTDGQALVWDNTAQKWEPGTVSGGGGGMSRAQATAITLVFS